MAKPQQRTNGDSKILSVVWYKVLPANFGGQKAVAEFSRHLCGYTKLICLCSKNNDASGEPYDVRPVLPISKWQFLNPLVWRKIFLVVKQEKITHLMLEFPYHGIAGVICKKWLGVCLIINTHNIEFERFKQQGKWWWQLLYYYERWTLRKSNLVFLKTELDLQTVVDHFHLKKDACVVVPYGVSYKSTVEKATAKRLLRERHRIAKDEVIFLFAGTLDYGPNAEAVTAIYQTLVPLLNGFQQSYKVMICGRNKYPAFSNLNMMRNEKVIMAGEVDDIETYFQSANVFLNPVLSGGGVQTKIMDALSYNLTVVCFQSKSIGINHTGNKLCCVRDNDWEGFARAAFAMSDKQTPTPTAFFEAYNWSTIAKQAYNKMVTC